jgi:hypothetical protein
MAPRGAAPGNCQFSNTILDAFDTLTRASIEKIFYRQDNCTSELLDLLYINSNKVKKYYVYIDSICEIADGYLSESLDMRNAELFVNDFSNFFPYLFSRDRSKMRELTIDGLDEMISENKDREKKLKEIKDFIQTQKAKLKSGAREKQFLTDMEKELVVDKYD